MQTSNNGKAFITRREGVVDIHGDIKIKLDVQDIYKSYKDNLGFWTSGIGHWLRPDEQHKKDETLTGYQVQALFNQDVYDAEMEVNESVTISLKQHQYDALVSFAFNLNQAGKDNLQRSRLLKMVNSGKWTADSIMDGFTGWANKERREMEAILFNTGEYV